MFDCDKSAGKYDSIGRIWYLYSRIAFQTVIPGTNKPFLPKVFVTVFAHAPFLGSQSAPVIVKGFKLLPETLADLLTIIHDELMHLENDVVDRLNVSWWLKSS